MTAKKRGKQPRYSIIPAAAVTDARLQFSDLRVLNLLGIHTNKLGWCRRSQVKMAAQLNCSRGTVQNALNRLYEAGYVERRLGSRPGQEADPSKQPFASYHYRVKMDMDEWPSEAVDPSADDDDDETATPVASDGGCQPVSTGGAKPLAPGASPELAPGASPTLAPLERPSDKSPTNNDNPPTPPNGGLHAPAAREEGATEEGEPPEFATFWKNFTGHEVMDRDRALEEFIALTAYERLWAANASKPYSDRLEAMKRKPVDAYKWLNRKQFEEFPHSKPSPSARAARFVALESPEWRALRVLYRIRLIPLTEVACIATGPGGVKGMQSLVELTPYEIEQLARFEPAPMPPPPDDVGDEPVDLGGWSIAEERGQQLTAWSKRMTEWFGSGLKPDRIYIGGHHHTFDGSGRPLVVKKRRDGVLVPSEWPPRKNRESTA